MIKFHIRKTAINALAEFKDVIDDEAIKEILGRLRDENRDISWAAIESLSVFKERIPNKAIEDIENHIKPAGILDVIIRICRCSDIKLEKSVIMPLMYFSYLETNWMIRQSKQSHVFSRIRMKLGRCVVMQYPRFQYKSLK